jgi:CRP-like cAMP-binding protein
VIVAGEVEVLRAGELVRTMGRGDAFGEIALLRDTPRTATIRARRPLRLYTLHRRDFLPAVSAYRASLAEAGNTVAGYLRTDAHRQAGGAPPAA